MCAVLFFLFLLYIFFGGLFLLCEASAIKWALDSVGLWFRPMFHCVYAPVSTRNHQSSVMSHLLMRWFGRMVFLQPANVECVRAGMGTNLRINYGTIPTNK